MAKKEKKSNFVGFTYEPLNLDLLKSGKKKKDEKQIPDNQESILEKEEQIKDASNSFSIDTNHPFSQKSGAEEVSVVQGGFTGSFQYSRDKKAALKSQTAQAEYRLRNSDQKELSSDLELDSNRRRWSWVEIDTSAIEHNVRTVKRFIGNRCKLMAVVKANAYGHGAINCARHAILAGAACCGVATVDEAIELRNAKIDVPIILLSEPPKDSIPLLLHYDITPSVYTFDFIMTYAEAADRLHMVVPYHLAVNTGMNRIGVHYSEVVAFLEQVSFHRAIKLEGTFTHFATADCVDTFDFELQYSHFIEALNSIREAGYKPGIVHAANSATILRYPHAHFDMVRLGISLYGLYPSRECYGLLNLKPVMSVHARITDVRTPALGEGVSYGFKYRSRGSVAICTVPIGYADGLRRNLSNGTSFLLRGIRCPQVGNICMDQCMFEVDLRTTLSHEKIDPQIGDEVVIVGTSGENSISLDDMALGLGTIHYELSCGFGMRMPKVYVNGSD